MSTDAITVALCTSGHRATKRIRGATDPPGSIVEGYDAGKSFAVHELSVAGIYGLARTLDLVASDPRTFVLRGEPLPGIDRNRCRRLRHPHEDGSPATFREVPRRWVVIDFDKVRGSDGLDPRWRGGGSCRSRQLRRWVMAEAPDPFDPALLRLDPAAGLVGIKRVVANVPIRRPKRQEFIRVHPDPGQRLNTALIKLKEERETRKRAARAEERPSASLL